MEMKQDIRKVVLDRLAELGWSRYRLVKEVRKAGGDFSPVSIYVWLRGEHQSVGLPCLSAISDVLGLSLVASSKR